MLRRWLISSKIDEGDFLSFNSYVDNCSDVVPVLVGVDCLCEQTEKEETSSVEV